MKKKNNYFTLLENSIKVVEDKNKKLYQTLIDKTKTDLINLFEKNNYSRTDYYQAEQYYAILNNLHNRLTAIGVEQEKILTQALKDMYLEIKKQVGLDIGMPMNANMFSLDPVVKVVWCRDGLAYDERIWRNNAEVQEVLGNGIANVLMRGGSKEEIIDDLLPLCNQVGASAYNRARTLVNTELAYVRAKATLDEYREAGIEEYVFLNTDDDKECDECDKMNGKTFKVKDAVIGVNFPPVHPNCRGWTKAVIK